MKPLEVWTVTLILQSGAIHTINTTKDNAQMIWRKWIDFIADQGSPSFQIADPAGSISWRWSDVAIVQIEKNP